MRSLTISLVVAAVLAAGPPAAAQTADPVSQAAGQLPPTLFEPAPETLPGRPAADASGTSLVIAGLLLAGAAAAGYFTGSSRRTRRS
jgi:hypothetical protein